MSHRDPRRPSAPEPAAEELPAPQRSRARRQVPTEPAAPRDADHDTAIPVPRDARRVNLTSRRREPAVEADDTAREPAAPPPSPRSRSRRDAAPPPTDPASDPTDPALWDEATREWAETTDDGWEEALAPVEPVAPPARRGRARPRGRSRPRQPIALPAFRLPGFPPLATLVSDQLAMVLLGVGAGGVMVMAAILSGRLDGVPETVIIHLDAAGLPDRWGPASILWRLPLLAAMTLLLNLVIAWAVAPLDRFAGRFVLAAALVVQVIAWVATIDFLF